MPKIRNGSKAAANFLDSLFRKNKALKRKIRNKCSHRNPIKIAVNILKTTMINIVVIQSFSGGKDNLIFITKFYLLLLTLYGSN